MQNIRRATKKHRKLLIVVVAILCVGVVGFFGAGKNNYSKTGGQEQTIAEQIAYYEKTIAETEPATVAEADYGTASSMASLYTQYANLCYDGAVEAQNAAYTQELDENGEAVLDENDSPVYTITDQNALNLAMTYQTKYTLAMGKVVEYYQQAIDTAPDVMNDLALAQLYGNLASARMSTGGDATQVADDFAKALELAPDDATVNLQYSQYLAGTQGYQAAADHLAALLEKLPEDDAAYSTVQTYSMIYSMYAGSSTGDDDGLEPPLSDDTPEDAEPTE